MIELGVNRIGTSAHFIFIIKNKMDLKKLLLKAINTSIKGGQAILKIYETDFDVDYKQDNSPLTIADKRCNEIIESDLMSTSIPILSEEGKHTDFNERKKWKYLWLVDPLDGTKEFVKKMGVYSKYLFNKKWQTYYRCCFCSSKWSNLFWNERSGLV